MNKEDALQLAARPRQWILILALSIFGCCENVDAAADANELRSFLQGYLAQDELSDTMYSTAVVKFGWPPKEEILVYITGPGWCGSGGCRLLVLERQNNEYKVLGNVTIVRPPIRVLNSTTNGRPDIGVWVQGGGIETGYEAGLPFNGESYASNPTISPARQLSNDAIGKILIRREDMGKPLIER